MLPIFSIINIKKNNFSLNTLNIHPSRRKLIVTLSPPVYRTGRSKGGGKRLLHNRATNLNVNNSPYLAALLKLFTQKLLFLITG